MVGGKENVSKTTTADGGRNERLRRRLMLRMKLSRPLAGAALEISDRQPPSAKSSILQSQPDPPRGSPSAPVSSLRIIRVRSGVLPTFSAHHDSSSSYPLNLRSHSLRPAHSEEIEEPLPSGLRGRFRRAGRSARCRLRAIGGRGAERAPHLLQALRV